MSEVQFSRRSLLGAVGAVSLTSSSLAAAASLPEGAATGGSLELVLRLGPAQPGTGNHRWAPIASGLAQGEGMLGWVRSGRVDWQVDPASGAAEAVATCSVERADGKLVQLNRAALCATRLENGLVVLRAFS